jgi:hypothetical protein
MTPEWKRYWYTRLVGGIYKKKRLDRNDIPMGYCEDCGVATEVQPLGPGGTWVCLDCSLKDPKTMNEELAKLNRVRDAKKNSA